MATRYTNFPNGVKTFPRSDAVSIKTANYTTVLADMLGSTIICNSAAAMTVTMIILTSAVGGIVTIVNNKDGQLLTVDPNAADGIGFANNVTDGKTIVNTAATAKKGDYVTLASVGAGATAATYWTVVAMQGIWADGA